MFSLENKALSKIPFQVIYCRAKAILQLYE